MLLHVTDHAFVRMGDWHKEFRQFVPRGLLLDYPQALGVLNGLHVFVASLERGRPSMRSEKESRRIARKYGNFSFFIFDRPLQDRYTLVREHYGLSLVTVTAIDDEHADQMLDDPHPPARFADVDEIRLPYALNGVLQDDPEFLSLLTPAGREIRLSYDPMFVPKTDQPLLRARRRTSETNSRVRL